MPPGSRGLVSPVNARPRLGRAAAIVVFATIFASAWAQDPAGNEFQVNTDTTGGQTDASVAMDASGNFVVVWESGGQDGSGFDVFGRRFDDSGVPQAAEFRVNSYTTNAQAFPAVASDAAGNFVVVWSKTNSGPSDPNGAFGRRFDASGVPQGLPFQANSYPNVGWFPQVASDASGNFFVVWRIDGEDGSNWGTFGQRFDASAVRQGAEFRVNTYTTSDQGSPSVASNPDGDFVVAWQSRRIGTSYDVMAQRYGDLIFQDGFESNDLASWSSASTDNFDLDAAGGGAALAGTGVGLQGFVDDANTLYVQDDTPSAEGRYRARFYFDPNGFDPGEAGGFLRVRIFIAFNAANERLITLVLRRLGGAYSLMGRVRRDDGTRADTGFFPITDDPHFVEFDWQRSSAPGAFDGQFVMRIDDDVVSTLFGIGNDGSRVESARLGVMRIKTAAASGILYFDQFESRQARYIGPE